jgi:hypothetical protein
MRIQFYFGRAIPHGAEAAAGQHSPLRMTDLISSLGPLSLLATPIVLRYPPCNPAPHPARPHDRNIPLIPAHPPPDGRGRAGRGQRRHGLCGAARRGRPPSAAPLGVAQGTGPFPQAARPPAPSPGPWRSAAPSTAPPWGSAAPWRPSQPPTPGSAYQLVHPESLAKPSVTHQKTHSCSNLSISEGQHLAEAF